MAITSRRTGLKTGFAKPQTPRTELIWWMNDGSTSKESHRGISTANSYQGHALNDVGNRASERELVQAKNTRRAL